MHKVGHSLPFSLSPLEIKKNTELLSSFLKEHNLDAYYAVSSDPYLNEYTPLEESHRYYFTGFTGSVGDVLVLKEGQVILFVDGRYHEQADLQTDSQYVEVVKCPYGLMPFTALKNRLKELKLKNLGIEGTRTALKASSDLAEICPIVPLDEEKLNKSINFKTAPCLGQAYFLKEELTGASTLKKLQLITAEHPAFFLSHLDGIAWLTNARGYQLPYQSTFRAKAFLTPSKIFLFAPEETDLHQDFEKNPLIEVVRGPLSLIGQKLKKLKDENKIKEIKVACEYARITASDYQNLCQVFGTHQVYNKEKGILAFQAPKNAVEIAQFSLSFAQADQAIKKTILWVKEQIKKGESFSELDYYHQANAFYKETGAKAQSFHTIAAFGPNSSIIHYGSPSEFVLMTADQLVLLDSGAYYEAGLATDCTRTFLSGGKASSLQQKIYTLVLKSLLNVQNALFPPKTTGAFIDGVCRMPMLRHGFNYAHGTGHGVGINVHEGAYSLVPTSSVPLTEGLVGSLEPGIYLPGIGGVRLENVCVVEKDPTHSDFLRFRPLSFVGFDFELIDFSLLNSEEIIWLNEYQKECEKRGTAI